MMQMEITMQYDQYQGKVKKVAAFLAKVYAVRVFLIIALATLAHIGRSRGAES